MGRAYKTMLSHNLCGKQFRMRNWIPKAIYPEWTGLSWWLPAPHFFCPYFQLKSRESQVCSPKQLHKMPAASWLTSSFLMPTTSNQSTPEALIFDYKAFPLKTSACISAKHKWCWLASLLYQALNKQPICFHFWVASFISTTQIVVI